MRLNKARATPEELAPAAFRKLRFRETGKTLTVGTIVGPAIAPVAWLARIRSSLLLKTASSLLPRRQALAAKRFPTTEQYNGPGQR
jgi:hypothetical protein